MYASSRASWARVELLILDDWGLAPLTSQQGRDLLEIVDDQPRPRLNDRGPVSSPSITGHELIVDPTIARTPSSTAS